MTDPRLDQVIDMLTQIGAKVGVDFTQAEVPPEETQEEEMSKDEYLAMKPAAREEIDRKKVLGKEM